MALRIFKKRSRVVFYVAVLALVLNWLGWLDPVTGWVSELVRSF